MSIDRMKMAYAMADFEKARKIYECAKRLVNNDRNLASTERQELWRQLILDAPDVADQVVMGKLPDFKQLHDNVKAEAAKARQADEDLWRSQSAWDPSEIQQRIQELRDKARANGNGTIAI